MVVDKPSAALVAFDKLSRELRRWVSLLDGRYPPSRVHNQTERETDERHASERHLGATGGTPPGAHANNRPAPREGERTREPSSHAPSRTADTKNPKPDAPISGCTRPVPDSSTLSPRRTPDSPCPPRDTSPPTHPQPDTRQVLAQRLSDLIGRIAKQKQAADPGPTSDIANRARARPLRACAENPYTARFVRMRASP